MENQNGRLNQKKSTFYTNFRAFLAHSRSLTEDIFLIIDRKPRVYNSKHTLVKAF